MSLNQKLLKGLRDFTRKLKAGVPIEATRVERYETPDGPMHVRKHVVLFVPPADGTEKQ